MPTSSASTTSLSSSIDLNGPRELLIKQLLEFLMPLETHLTSYIDHDNLVGQQTIQQIRDLVIITEQWGITCDDINVSTAWVSLILDGNIVWDEELLELFVTFVERTSLPIARFDILKLKLTQQQYGDTMDLHITETHTNQDGIVEPTFLDGAAISAGPVASARALSGDNDPATPLASATADVSATNGASVRASTAAAVPLSFNNPQHTDAHAAVGTDAAALSARMAVLGEWHHNGVSVHASPGSRPAASSESPMVDVLKKSIAYYETKKPAFWYASHIAKLNEIAKKQESSAMVSALVDYNFHFTDGIIRPQSLIGGWFNRGTLFSKDEREEGALSNAMNSTPSEIVEALASKRGFDGIEIRPENKNQFIPAIFCWDLSSRGSKSRKALQAITGDYITSGAQDLISVDPSNEHSKTIAKVTVLKSLVYNGLKSYLSDKTKSWTDKLSKVIAKLKQRSNDSDYQSLDSESQPIIAEKNRFAATNVCALFNLRTDVMNPNIYASLHDQDALDMDIDADTIASRTSGV